ncbi:MAG TPA: KEOPS complex subunit Pcc1 [Methanocorpusculum sp.]|nr:KEOPS complex subunit Pcc1 [Methanocorpusculum sp.]HJJ40003.1 KEOPS complex subunit Pcc1 [Methanocorpusculum sp.]HJJ49486.1 KEOPS complex subunit Pcc1 [Methanocorpusculum sp.]HJJ57038.1 KEOPS complex subunit Pcc1 [Methanocorpusculum sp.]HJJ95336.1 KEOPS complex subunit Pcc1 [Methanocorpusculum sp.]
MIISGKIVSETESADEISRALSPDNGGFMECRAEGTTICAEFSGESPKTVLATVDDYLMNLSVAWGVVNTACKEQQKKQ